MYTFIFHNENLQEYKETAIFLMVPIAFAAEPIALQLVLPLPLQPHQHRKGKEDPGVFQQVLCVKGMLPRPKPVVLYNLALQLLGTTQ